MLRFDGSSVRPFAVVMAIALLVQADGSFLSLLLPEIRGSLHLTIQQAGLLGGVGVLGLPAEVFTSYLADRMRRTRLLSICVTAFGVFTALTGAVGFVAALPLLYLARFGVALSGGISSTGLSLLSDSYSPAARPRLFFAVQLSDPLASWLGPLAAGVLAAWAGWQWPFLLFALPTVIYALLIPRLMREPARGATDPEGVPAGPAPGLLASLGTLLSRPTVVLFYLGVAVSATALAVLTTYVNIYYADVWHAGPGLRGLLTSLLAPAQAAGLVVGGLAAAVLMKRSVHALLALIGVGFLLGAVEAVVLATAGSLAMAVVANLTGHAFFVMLLPGLRSVVSTVLPASTRTFGFAAGGIVAVVSLPALAFAGHVADVQGVRVAFVLAAPLAVVGAVLIGAMTLTIGRDQRRQALTVSPGNRGEGDANGASA